MAASSQPLGPATGYANGGYSPRLQCYAKTSCNIIADRPGSKTGKTILATAHFDSVGKPFAGADDNGSRTAALLDAAQHLADHASQSAADQLAQIEFVLDLDMVGVSSPKTVEVASDRVGR